MSETSRGLRKLVKILDEMRIPNMLIGGYALPAYGNPRATFDFDLAIAVRSFETIKELHECLTKNGYQLPTSPLQRAPVFVATDMLNRVEFELWTKPDGITFDEDLLNRRIKVRPFNDDFKMFAIGPEDFIVNKLARTDRGVRDETDVVTVLQRQKGKLDYVYLEKRAKDADVLSLLTTLINQTR